MARIQGFTAPSAIRSSDQGFSAFETYGRRVAGQFDQAANDIREIGRSKAAVTNMLGRWPLNIIDLEQRAQAEADKRNQNQGQSPAAFRTGGAFGGQRVNFNVVRPERGVQHNSGVDSAGDRGGHIGSGSGSGRGTGSYDQMSEGAGRLGSMLGGMGGTMSPEYRRAIQAQQDAEQSRIDRLDQAASDKRFNLYEKNLDTYNQNLDKWAAQPAFSEGNPYPVNQPVSTSTDPNSPYSGRNLDIGGGGTDIPAPSTDYGGGGGWNWNPFTSGNAFEGADTSGTF